MAVKTRIATWGSSLAIRIPKPIADQWGVSAGSAVELVPDEDTLVLRKYSYDLDTLLAEITPENVHREIENGYPQGESSNELVPPDRDMEKPTMKQRQASKYQTALELKWQRARKHWKCYACGQEINPGDYYYRQSLGLINKPPRVTLNTFCAECADSPLTKKLTENPRRYAVTQAHEPRGPRLFS